MKIPIETKPALWGVAGGAAALAVIGFTWGGWVTGGGAETTAVQRANAAVAEALAPICVDKFQHASDCVGQPGRTQGDRIPGHRVTSSRRVAGPPSRERTRQSKCRRSARACASMLTSA